MVMQYMTDKMYINITKQVKNWSNVVKIVSYFEIIIKNTNMARTIILYVNLIIIIMSPRVSYISF